MTDFRPSGLGLDNSAYVRPLHSTPEGPYAVAITPGAAAPVPGWRHTTLRVAWLDAGASVGHDLGDEETIVVPLAGGFDVVIEDAAGARHEITLAGRESVFAGATDVAYAGRGSRVTVTNTAGIAGRVALAGGPAMRGKAPKPVRHITTDEVPVEHRGAGIASREVRAFGLPGVLDADSILVCEVLTPSGNWSSWPPHKHDTERPGLEAGRGDLLLRDAVHRPPRDRSRWLSAGLWQRGPAGGHSGRGAHGRCRARAAWLAWTGDRGAGRGSLLPQRHGRAGARAGLAHL